MEGKKPGASSSSIVEDLFGRKDKSSEIFGFSAPSSTPGRKQEAEGKNWNDKNATADGSSNGCPGKGQSVPSKVKNSDYQGETITPCHLSSSLYYGGQDIYSNCPSTQTSGTQYTYKKDGEDDQNNSNLASRGNWWQGSLYY